MPRRSASAGRRGKNAIFARFLRMFALFVNNVPCSFVLLFDAPSQSVIGLTLEEKDEICPRRIRTSHGKIREFHFDMLRQNINKRNVSYTCVHKRGCSCNATLSFKRSEESGMVDITNKTWRNKHSRKCVVIENSSLDPDDYPWDGKPVPEEPDDLGDWTETLGPNAGPTAAALWPRCGHPI